MSRFDNIIENINERIVSRDINNLQSVIARTVSELARGTFAQGVGALAQAPRQVALGLRLSVLGQVDPGAILLESNVPPPGAFDSNYRVGLSLSTVNVVPLIPSPLVDTWHLFEASLSTAAQTIENRDVYNDLAEVFVPGTPVPKIETYGITFRFRAGTATSLPALAAGWVPLYAVLIDPGQNFLRLVPVHPRPTFEPTRFSTPQPAVLARRTSREPNFAGSLWSVDARIRDEYGELAVRTPVGVNMTSGDFTAPGVLPLVNGTRYYLYACRWNPTVAGPAVEPQPGVEGDAILLLSATAPTPGGLLPTGAPTLPAPYDGSVGTSWVAIDSARWLAPDFDPGQTTGLEDTFAAVGPITSYPAANPLSMTYSINLAALPFLIPSYARQVILGVTITATPSVPGSTWTGGTIAFSPPIGRYVSFAVAPQFPGNAADVVQTVSFVVTINRFGEGPINDLYDIIVNLGGQVGNCEGTIQASVLGVRIG